MDTELDFNKQSDKDYVEAVHDVGKMIIYRILRPWFFNSFIFNNLSVEGRKQPKVLNTLFSFTESIIKKREKDFKVFETNETELRRKSMLDLLLEAKVNGKIDDVGIMDEVNSAMFGVR